MLWVEDCGATLSETLRNGARLARRHHANHSSGHRLDDSVSHRSKPVCPWGLGIFGDPITMGVALVALVGQATDLLEVFRKLRRRVQPQLDSLRVESCHIVPVGMLAKLCRRDV